jgi:hypothetical protein
MVPHQSWDHVTIVYIFANCECHMSSLWWCGEWHCSDPLTVDIRFQFWFLTIGCRTCQKPHKYAYCGPPLHTNVNADWIKAWIVYHNYIFNGDALYFFYNVGGLKDEDRHLFNDFVDAGLLNITDRPSHYSQLYPSWYFHQALFIQDCLQRARFLADYVFFFDFDEFLQVFLFVLFKLLFLYVLY